MSLVSSSLRSPFHCPRHSHLTAAGVLARCTSSSAEFSTRVSIERTDARSDSAHGRPYALFFVTVAFSCTVCGPDTWTVQRRYSEFDELHSTLSGEVEAAAAAANPSAAPVRLPSLPPKKFLGSSMDADFLKERRAQLEAYLTRLVSQEALHSSPALVHFLQHPASDALVAMNDAINSVRVHNVQLQAQITALQAAVRALTNDAVPAPPLPSPTLAANGHVPTPLSSSSSQSISPILKELSRLKRRIRLLESLPSAHGVEDEDAGWTGAAVGSMGRSRSHGAGLSDEDDSEEGGRGRHKDSMSRTDRARSLSQRTAAATREKRRYRRGLGGGLPQPATGAGEEEGEEDDGEERGRSLSESHVMDRLAMRHFHYRTHASLRQNPFALGKAVVKRGDDGAAGAMVGGVSSIKEEDSPQQRRTHGLHVHQQLAERSSRRARHSEPIANYYHPFMSDGKSSSPPSGSSSSAAANASSFFASFGPTLHRTPFSSTSSSSAFPTLPKPPSGIGSLLQQQQYSRTVTVTQPIPRAHPPAHDGYDSGGHLDVVLGSSPSTSAMALISEGVANAVLDSTPNASPLNSPITSSHRQRDRGASDGEGSTSDQASNGGSSSERRRHALLNKIPPPQLKLGELHRPQKDGLSSSSSPSKPSSISAAHTEPQLVEEHKTAAPSSPSPSKPSPSSVNAGGVVSPGKQLASPDDASAAAAVTVAPGQSPPHSSSLLDLSSALFPHDALYAACLDGELHARMTDLVQFIQPSLASEQRYAAVFQFVDGLIRRTIGAEVMVHGSFALKTYLPDADLDVSAFFSKSNDDSWIHRLMAALCQEAAGGAVAPSSTGASSGGGGKDKDRNRDRDRERERERERDAALSAAASSASARLFPVKSVTFISAETAVIKCQVGHISVDISGNQTGALSTLALFEEVDQLVGSEHLFKRAILLCSTWFKNELMASGSHMGFLSSYCIRTFVLFIFNRHHSDIRSPLQALYRLVCYLAHFDWNAHAFGLFGPIELRTLPKYVPVTSGPTAWPLALTPLVTPALLQSYSQLPPDAALSAPSSTRSFPVRYINVIDPANICNNLGRSVSNHQNVVMIHAALRDGAYKLTQALLAWTMRPRIDLKPARSIASSTASLATASTDKGDEGSAAGEPGSSPAPAEPTALTPSSNTSPLSGASLRGSALMNDEEAEQLQADEDVRESYRVVQQLFERTLHTYSGRTAFPLPPRTQRKQRPSALPILGADGQPLSVADKASLVSSSRPLTPSLSTPSSPAPSTLISDSELETESDLASPIEHASPHLGGSGSHLLPSSSSHGLSSHASTRASLSNALLDGKLSSILEQLQHARQFEVPDVSEAELVAMIQRILGQYGSVPVGKLGSLLHNHMNNHSLPSMLKEKFGGLKRFLERHLDLFTIGTDHPFNPHVHLMADYLAQQQQLQAAAAGAAQGMSGYPVGDALMTATGSGDVSARPGRTGHTGRPAGRQPPQGQSQQSASVHGGRSQQKPHGGAGAPGSQGGLWMHHGSAAGGMVQGMRGGGAQSSSLNSSYSSSPHSPPIPDHAHASGANAHSAAQQLSSLPSPSFARTTPRCYSPSSLPRPGTPAVVSIDLVPRAAALVLCWVAVGWPSALRVDRGSQRHRTRIRQLI